MAGALEELKKLDQQRQKLIENAKQEAMKKAQAAVDELNSLGFNFELKERKSRNGSSRSGTRAVKDKPCPICRFKTDPPHDRRRHSKHKSAKNRAFTNEELQEMGLRRVS
jgi:single-stranded DNA-specific DHH superfamily exonuclease